MSGFDIIGDIHGAADQLLELLELLGYREDSGVFLHPKRRIVFLGDFIDRGPKQRQVIDIVRPMIEEGSALAVIGNHEFNAIAYATEDPERPGEYLRPHNQRNNTQHASFLDAYPDQAEYQDVIGWFRTLPLFLEFDSFRVVHACWHANYLEYLEPYLNSENTLDDDLVIRGSRPEDRAFVALETLLKGLEIPLPDGCFFLDKDGVRRDSIRTRWWLSERVSYREMAFLSSDIAAGLPDELPPPGVSVNYPKTEKPVFVGHYWLRGTPEIMSSNVCCVDFSVGKPGGKLCCYRFDGESRLSTGKILWVTRPVGSR